MVSITDVFVICDCGNRINTKSKFPEGFSMAGYNCSKCGARIKLEITITR